MLYMYRVQVRVCEGVLSECLFAFRDDKPKIEYNRFPCFDYSVFLVYCHTNYILSNVEKVE